ncbi:hypothetical protein R3P38DRAFT_3101778 [Favolaschia claudopus]|uniref:NADH dehydrogenase subunit 6 n=1 Tax=Favolaschia claudopus TaxID=2862362 RepID=A0AAV9ZM95_9AGAR
MSCRGMSCSSPSVLSCFLLFYVLALGSGFLAFWGCSLAPFMFLCFFLLGLPFLGCLRGGVLSELSIGVEGKGRQCDGWIGKSRGYGCD